MLTLEPSFDRIRLQISRLIWATIMAMVVAGFSIGRLATAIQPPSLPAAEQLATDAE